MKTYEATEQAYKNGYAKGYEDGMAEMETDNNRLRSMWAKAVSEASKADAQIPRWIPVTERLPDTQEYDWVLAQVAFIPGNLYGVPVVAELRNGEWYDAYDETIEGDFEKVTHWMPLPEPPKGE